MKELTVRQKQILDFIQHKQESEKLSPTLREIAAHFHFSSANAALAHVQALRAKGVVKNLPGRARSLQVLGWSDLEAPASRQPGHFAGRGPNAGEDPTASGSRIVSVPIYGSIPAGRPADATQAQEGCVLIDVDTLGIKATARTFGLKVQGDSMIGKSIIEGDIVIIEHGVQPRSGDVVAALIDGQVTLKTFVLQQGKPYLRAENPRYPKLIPQEELQIQGVMVALVRRRK
ncbi:MAG TPA: transcriptional repressor LexA [Verrucomicrobiae bacterium]|nr:transcriptional repressor LexA [Verrucomicrobiae bacterium]